MSSSRRVVFVVGSGRSGTSTMAGTLRTLGLHVPQPEVVADATNPKGFGEPRWVVDLHDELLQRSNVQVSDARPRAWLDTGTTSGDHATRERVAAWLEEQFSVADELVVKDPRASWFLGLWRAAADRCDATPAYVTMLRPVTEVVGSKQTYYGQMGAGSDQGAWARAAAARAPWPAPCARSACTCRSPRWSPTRPTPRVSASRGGWSTSTTSCSSAATCRSPTRGRGPGSRPARPAATTPLRERVATWLEEPVRGRRRARRQGPARGVVPRPVARRGRPLRRHVVVRHDAAAGDRGGRLQADLLRAMDGERCRVRPGRHHPHRRVGQHDAPHRARDPRPAARLRPLRRPARRLDPAGLRPRRGLRPPGREDRDGRRHRRGAPLHRPLAAPGDDDLGRHRRARPAARARRRDLAGARRDRRATTRRRTRSGATSCAPPTPTSTPRPRRSPTRPSWPSGVRAAADARRDALEQAPARSAADRVPHAVRAMVPPAARQKLRKAMGRERPQGSA